MPFDPYASQPMPYIDIQSLWNPTTRRAPDVRNVTSSMPVRSPVRLSVQPAKIKAKQRRRSTPRKTEGLKRDSCIAQPALNNLNVFRPAEPAGRQSTPTTSHIKSTCAVPDTLFSSIVSEKGRPYDPKNLCDLCRRPFEAEETALYAHLSKHLRELDGSFACEKCHTAFSHEGDLKWHQQSSEDGDCTGQVASGWENTDRLNFCVRLRKWEQAQLQLHSRTIDSLCQARSSQSRPRPSSLPPRKRRTLCITIDEDTEKKHARQPPPDANVMTDNACTDKANGSKDDQAQDAQFDTVDASSYRNKTTTLELESQKQSDAFMVEQTCSTTEQTMHSLQQRILDLMETIQPDLAENDDRPTPYSEFCDSHSLPGTPENYQRSQPFERDCRADRATSEPPRRIQSVEECWKGAAPYKGDSERGRTSGAWNLGPSNTGQGQKRSSDDHDPDQWERDGPNGPLQPKKRKTVSGSTNANEKRFPCIFHIGEPERFAKDLTRHRHISNMW